MEQYVSIHLDDSSQDPLYIQIFLGISEMIKEGSLTFGEKLPSIRSLSSFLKVNSGTVVSAYKFLEEKGYVISKMGSGTYISFDSVPTKANGKPAETSEFQEYSFSPETGSRYAYDFKGTSISPEFFPVKEFKEVLDEVLNRDKGYAFGYQEPEGYLPLREAIGDVLLKKLGITPSPEMIQIVSGAQQGIDVVAKAMLNFRDTVFVESPTYIGAVNAFRTYGANIAEVPIKKDGVDMVRFRSLLKGSSPKLFYSMPNFQNPTGYDYSEGKRKELLDLALEFDFYIVEDDHINDLFYNKEPALLKSIDKNNRVFYIKSFSKPFMPGIRLAFILPPAAFSEEIVQAKYSADIFSPGLFQRSMELFLRRGYWEENARKIRKLFAQRRDMMAESLKKHMPEGVQFYIPKGGVFFWLTLPKGFYSMNLYNEAQREGVLIVPGDLFHLDRHPSPSFRLSIAEIEPENIDPGIKLLSEIIKTHIKTHPATSFGPRPML